MKVSTALRRLAIAGAVVLVGAVTACGGGSGSNSAGGKKDKDFVIGVSNTLVGNGWRETMICSVKAQSLVSGKVKKVISANRNGSATEQIADLRNLISQGVDAIIVDPVDPTKLNNVIKEATNKGIVVVAVDQAVTAPEAYIATNDQVAYGRIGAEWLAKQLGGKGNVVEMRGIAGAQADTDRHQGFTEEMKKYPDIKIVKEVYTGWDFSKAGQQALDILNSATKVDGIWTSGTDYVVVKAMQTLNKPYIPVVGADTNEFINQTLTLADKGFKGAVVTNPATIGAVGVSIALKALADENPQKVTHLTPEVWDAATGKDKLQANYYPDREATFSTQALVPPYTTYTKEQLFACKGPGE
jgi:ribose transport system substrate-binding protein